MRVELPKDPVVGQELTPGTACPTPALLAAVRAHISSASVSERQDLGQVTSWLLTRSSCPLFTPIFDPAQKEPPPTCC